MQENISQTVKINKRGRKPLPQDEKRSEVHRIFLTPDEAAEAMAAAKRANKPITVWERDCIVEGAAR